MSVTYSSYLVAGIALNEYFTNVHEKDESYEEHDSHGNLTGKIIKKSGLYASKPDKKLVKIGNKNSYGNWDFDFYNSIDFDCDLYIGENKDDDCKLELYMVDHESEKLSEYVIGIKISEITDYKNIKEVNLEKISTISILVTKQLKKYFNYIGFVKLYLMNYIGY